MTEKNVTDAAFKCHHCHQTTYMSILGSASRDIKDIKLSYLGSDEADKRPHPRLPPIEEAWEILLCPNCDKANVHYGVRLYGDLIEGDRIIYPPAITYTAPKDIDLQFRAAIGVIHVNPAAAVNQFRVVLEMIWQQHTGKVPAKSPPVRSNSGIIQELVKAHVLPGNYADMADVLANIGNEGSHGSAANVTREDAEMARQLCQIILEHVYRMRPEGMDLMKRLESKFPRKSGWRDGQYVDDKHW